MIDKNNFEERIFTGLKRSYNNAFSFNGEIDTTIKPEYLITVNIAQSLNELNEENKDFGNPLTIKLEESTLRFSSACVPLFSNPTTLFDNEIRDFKNTIRNGRLDIAVYLSTTNVFEKIPYAAIEVKGFTNSVNPLKEDIKRNLEYLGFLDDKTGESKLEQTYLVFLHEHKNCITTDKKEEGIETLKNTYIQYLEELNEIKDTNISFRIEAQTIAENLINKSQKDWPDDVLQGIYEQSYHYIGALIILEKSSDGR